MKNVTLNTVGTLIQFNLTKQARKGAFEYLYLSAHQSHYDPAHSSSSPRERREAIRPLLTTETLSVTGRQTVI